MKKSINIINIVVLLLGIVISIAPLASCTTYQTVTDYRYESAQGDYNNKYRGYTRAQIINDMGAPDRIVPVEGQSVILVYEKYKVRRPVDPLGLGIGSYSYERDWYIEFYIGNDSKCYNVKTNKLKAIPYQKTIKKSPWEW